ncbi:MAG: J domain-containing protein, partial [Pseudomonadota bacterium]|nr:J domain-containing protein [Pseudomonadota bacterium]
ATLLAPGLLAPVPDLAAATQPAPGYVRPDLAPSGRPWPTHSGYVDGYVQLNRGGASEVLVDNSRSEVDMFAKLVALDGPAPTPVRTFYLAAHSRFTLSGLPSGTYDLRYRNLASGTLARSPAFILEDIATPHGVQHGSMTVLLYQAATGNMLSYSLPEADF